MVRKPKFLVVTYSLVAIFLAALFLKALARYLPERQPNRLVDEYGTFVKTSAQEKVEWMPFGPEAFDLARATGKLVLLEIGSIYSKEGRIHRYSHLEDREYARLISTQFIPVKVDAFEAPWLVSLIDLNTNRFESANECLFVIMDGEGRIADITGLQAFSDSGAETSSSDYLSEIARQRFDKAEFENRVRGLEERRRQEEMAPLKEFPLTLAELEVLMSRFQSAVADSEFNRPRFTVSATAFEALERIEALGSRSAARVRSETLLRLRESPCFDSLTGSYFARATQDKFRTPSYGKNTAANAQLAVIYARAAQMASAPLFAQVASEIVNWLLHEMRDETSGLFFTGIGTDEYLLPGSDYYDMPQSAISEVLRPIFKLEETRGSRGALHLTEKADFESSVSQSRTNSIRIATAELRKVYSTTGLAPIRDETVYADQNGAIIGALFKIAAQTSDAELMRTASSAYSALAARFLLPLGEVLHAQVGLGRTTANSRDYAWFVHAAIQNYRYTGNSEALTQAVLVTDRLLELFLHPSGAIASTLLSHTDFLQCTVPVLEIQDGSLASVNSIVANNLFDLATITGSERYKKLGFAILRAFAGAQRERAVPAAGFVSAAAAYYDPRVICKGQPLGEIRNLQRAFPLIFICETTADMSDGYWLLAAGEVIYGPASYKDVTAQLVNLGF